MHSLDVLVVAGADDQHGNAVIEHLRGRGRSVGRFSLAELRSTAFSWSPGQSLVILNVGHVDRTTTVWWRRPGKVGVEDLEPAEAALTKSEGVALFEGILSSLPVRWVDAPSAIDWAEKKLYQLAVAQRLGIPIPESLVTNNVGDAALHAARSEIVAKPVSSGDGLAPFAQVVPSELLAHVGQAPVLLQARIKARADLRIVTVGDRVFQWRRERREDEPADWRQVDPHGAGFRHQHGGTEATVGALRVAKALDLSFTVQDWLETEAGVCFLEANPQGEWLFLSDAASLLLPAFADHLLAPGVNDGAWPKAWRQFLWDLLRAKDVPARSGLEPPVFEEPRWIAETSAADAEVLEHARQAHRRQEVRAEVAESKANRLVTLTLALLVVSFTLLGYLVEGLNEPWPTWLASLGVFACLGAIALLSIAGLEAFEVDRVGLYYQPGARSVARSAEPRRELIRIEEEGRRYAEWTADHKLTALMQARAWFSRGVVALVVAAFLVLGWSLWSSCQAGDNDEGTPPNAMTGWR